MGKIIQFSKNSHNEFSKKTLRPHDINSLFSNFWRSTGTFEAFKIDLKTEITTIISNTARYPTDTTIQISKCLYEYCRNTEEAPNSGGAISIPSTVVQTVSVVDSRFESCSSYGHGGSIYSSGAKNLQTSTFLRLCFYNSSSSIWSNAIHWQSPSNIVCTFQESTMIRCPANQKSINAVIFMGGHAQHQEAINSSSHFIKGKTQALCISSTTRNSIQKVSECKRCTISNTTGYRCYIWIENSGISTISNFNVVNNHNYKDYSLYHSFSETTISNSLFIRNEAPSIIIQRKSPEGSITFANCKIDKPIGTKKYENTEYTGNGIIIFDNTQYVQEPPFITLFSHENAWTNIRKCFMLLPSKAFTNIKDQNKSKNKRIKSINYLSFNQMRKMKLFIFYRSSETLQTLKTPIIKKSITKEIKLIETSEYQSYVGTSTVEVHNTLFSHCTKKQESSTDSDGGGAIYISFVKNNPQSVSITDSIFDSCYSDLSGGALRGIGSSSSASITWKGLCFYNASSGAWGNVIKWDVYSYQTINFSMSSITSCPAKNFNPRGLIYLAQNVQHQENLNSSAHHSTGILEALCLHSYTGQTSVLKRSSIFNTTSSGFVFYVAGFISMISECNFVEIRFDDEGVLFSHFQSNTVVENCLFWKNSKILVERLRNEGSFIITNCYIDNLQSISETFTTGVNPNTTLKIFGNSEINSLALISHGNPWTNIRKCFRIPPTKEFSNIKRVQNNWRKIIKTNLCFVFLRMNFFF